MDWMDILVLEIKTAVSQFQSSIFSVTDFESHVEKNFNKSENDDLDLTFLQLLTGSHFDSTGIQFNDMQFVETNKAEFADISFLQ